MTKKIVTKEVEHIELEYLTLKEAKEYMEKCIERYGEDAKIIDDGGYDDDGNRTRVFVITVTREETDEEYDMRLVQEEQWKKRKLESDLKTYEEIKKRLGLNV